MDRKELLRLMTVEKFLLRVDYAFMQSRDIQKAENRIVLLHNTLNQISKNTGLTIIAPNDILKKEREATVTDFAEADTPSDPDNYKTNFSLPENKVKYHADLQRLTPRIPFRRA